MRYSDDFIRRRLAARSKRNDSTGCLELIEGVATDGYGRMWDGERSTTTHRLAWLASRGVIPEGLHVLHQCDNPRCIELDHLWLGTPQDNTDDMIAKGRGVPVRGADHPKALIRNKRQARRIFKDQRKGTVIARAHGLSSSTVYAIKKRKLWAWATVDL